MLYQRMMKEKQKVEDRINDLQSQIDVLPSGTFFCTRNNKYYKWYYTDKGKTKYIPKSERKLAEQLVKRKYLESRLRKFKQEEKRIDIYLKQYSFFISCRGTSRVAETFVRSLCTVKARTG